MSSGVVGSPDRTMELMIETLRILREEEGFRGYIHAKAIPGSSPELVERLGRLADRLSVNVELPSQSSLDLLAPEKSRESVTAPMGLICDGIRQAGEDRALARRNNLRTMPRAFAPAGQSTQLIIGATPETDQHILKLAESLYGRFGLKRVFFSAYAPVNDDVRLPRIGMAPPLTREHRLYQADWLLRYYGFEVDELLSPQSPDLDEAIDPKASWALKNMDLFPLEVNRAGYEELLRVPGLGVRTARRIMGARAHGSLSFDDLKTLGLSLKRAGYFITCRGRMSPGFAADPETARRAMEQGYRTTGGGRKSMRGAVQGQLSLFEDAGQRAQDAFALPGHRDKLLDASRAKRLEAVPIDPARIAGGAGAGETPSGLPALDPLALERAGGERA